MKASVSLRRLSQRAKWERVLRSGAAIAILVLVANLLVVSLGRSAAVELGTLADGGSQANLLSPLVAAPISALSGEEQRPAVDYNPEINSYLVVWEDHQSDYGIGGVIAGEDGIPRTEAMDISVHSAVKRLAPAVACSGLTGECLVVWEYAYREDVDHDIYARRIDSSGEPVGGEIILTATFDYETSPAVAHNESSGEWLVVWSRARDVHNRDIEGAILDASGNIEGRVTVAGGLDDQANPAVAYGSNNDEYLVVWEDLAYTSEDLDLLAQRVAADGSLAGGVLAISTWEYEQIRPELDYNPDLDQFMVVWEDHHWAWGAAADIYGQRVSAAGALVGGNFGISWEESNLRLSPDIAYQRESQEYFVTWEYEHTGDDHDVHGRRVGANGELPGLESPVSNQNSWEGRPALASGSERSFLLVWEDYRDEATQMADIYGDVLVPVSPPSTATPTATATLKPSPTATATSTSTPTPTATATGEPPPPLDLQIEAIELTQGIQCKDNSLCKGGDNAVPLVLGKATYARIYVKVSGSSSAIAGVSARAIARVGYGSVLGIPLNETIQAPLVPDRAKFGDTLNFYFAADDLPASGSLVVTVNPDRAIRESNYANNSKTVALNFVQTPPLKIVPVWIHYKWNNHSSYVDLDMPWWLNRYVENILPVGEVQWLNLPGSSMLEWSEKVGPDGASWAKLLNEVADLKNKNIWWSYLEGPTGYAHFYGMFPFSERDGSQSGLGEYPGWVAVGLVEDHHANLEDLADNMVHELGHNFHRGHAPCGVSDADVGYPYANAALGDFGWDPQGAGGGKVQQLPGGWVVPQTAADVMSYCQDEWISEYTYRGILDYRGSTAAILSGAEVGMAMRVEVADENWRYLFVSGALNETLTLDPWSILEFPSGYHTQPGQGAYSLRLLDATRHTLFTRYFDMQESMPSWLAGAALSTAESAAASFYEVVPWNPATAYVQIWHGETRLAERALSASAPAVALLSPQGGEMWEAGQSYTIRWSAGDADGDPLWFDVAFSRDGGESWSVIASRRQESSLEVNADELSGTAQALVRVYASDGLRTSQRTSAPFSIADKGPSVLITQPDDFAALPPNMPLLLSGYAFDPEDGVLSSSSLAWSSDRAGYLGAGNEVLATLAPGWHTITLTASDHDGMSRSASVDIYLGYRIHAPLIRR